MNKPTVHYKPKSYCITVGEPALIQPLDHPSPLVSNTHFARTSKVLKITETGFETKNTIYVRSVI